ncbi:MAG: extracellular solute-binding protein [Anaerolineae bacterium]
MSRRALSIGLVVVLMASLGLGCSGLVPTQEPVTISFVHPEDVTGDYQQWVTEFQEQYPHITVELVSASSLSYDQYATKDAFIATQFELNSFLQQAAILSLSPFTEQDEELDLADFYPSALDVFSNQGRQWALPFGIDMMMVYYNKDIFDRYGVGYPQVGWDWGDFLDRALDTTDPGADVYGYALYYQGEAAIFEPVMMIYQNGGQIFDSLQSPTRVTLDNPQNVEAMEFYASLIHDHGVAPSQEEMQRMGRGYPWRGIADGRFAMWATMFSDRGGARWPVEWEMSWGLVPMPRALSAASLATSEGLFISAETEHPDVAWTWIRFLSEKSHPLLMPARRSLAESSEYERVAGEEVALAGQAALQDAILVNPNLLGFETALEALAQALTKIRSGEASPEVALSTAQEQAGY